MGAQHDGALRPDLAGLDGPAVHRRAVQTAMCCRDMLGGYTHPGAEPLLDAFHHGIETVINALERGYRVPSSALGCGHLEVSADPGEHLSGPCSTCGRWYVAGLQDLEARKAAPAEGDG